MKGRLLAATFIASALAWGGSSTPAEAAFIFCGTLDNGPGDFNGTPGIIQSNCNVGSGAFTGTAQEIKGFNRDVIRVVGTLTGNGALITTSDYDIGPWVGPGFLFASARGRYTGFPSLLTGLLVTGSANTFSNNPAQTGVAPVPPFFNVTDVNFGVWSGQGTLTGLLQWNAGPGIITLGQGVDFGAAITEPQVWAMMILGFGALGGALRRRRAALASAV